MVVTSLKFDNIGIGSRLESLLLVEALFGILVKGLQVGDFGRLFQEVGEAFIQFSDKHPKLGAPVAHVVDPEDLVAQELKDATDAVALNGRTQVTDVHVFRDVG